MSTARTDRLRPALRMALLAAMFAAAAASGLEARADSGNWKDVNSTSLTQHMVNLEGVVEACRKARNATACDSSLVGPDDRLQWTVGAAKQSREIRYDWLRSLLDRAGKKETAPATAASVLPHVSVVQEKPTTIDQQLGIAINRLKDEEQQADALTGAGARTANDLAGQHARLASILSRRAYKGVSESSMGNKFQEWLDNLINRLFGGLAGLGQKAWWLPELLFGLLIGGVLIGLGWALIQIERRSRIRLIPETDGTGRRALGSRVATLAQRRPVCGSEGVVARGNSFSLLGGHLAA